ncbi:hypothetical protein NPIL_372311 [Nephila pilipes]|uniref:Uncharacterized protein n=1 Tax=Nephila pilipes TaxID=299642 RepID=A0A8X6Q057_NEPPI|nr:hypothetical protein NPIL_372311 [Nephila pilipes]
MDYIDCVLWAVQEISLFPTCGFLLISELVARTLVKKLSNWVFWTDGLSNQTLIQSQQTSPPKYKNHHHYGGRTGVECDVQEDILTDVEFGNGTTEYLKR